jgi:hypothetical protein
MAAKSGVRQSVRFTTYIAVAASSPALSRSEPRQLPPSRAQGPGLFDSYTPPFVLPRPRGHMLADVSAIIGSLDIVFGEIDR